MKTKYPHPEKTLDALSDHFFLNKARYYAFREKVRALSPKTLVRTRTRLMKITFESDSYWMENAYAILSAEVVIRKRR